MKWVDNKKKFEWHKHFALLPRMISYFDDEIVWRPLRIKYIWFEMVERKAKFSYGGFGLKFYEWEYREIDKSK